MESKLVSDVWLESVLYCSLEEVKWPARGHTIGRTKSEQECRGMGQVSPEEQRTQPLFWEETGYYTRKQGHISGFCLPCYHLRSLLDFSHLGGTQVRAWQVAGRAGKLPGVFHFQHKCNSPCAEWMVLPFLLTCVSPSRRPRVMQTQPNFTF